jgi:lysophospholipase
MASKKTSSSSKKKLEATVKRLEAKLERADAKAARWKQKAKENKSALASSQARISELSEELTSRRPASRPATPSRAKPPSPTRTNSTTQTPVSPARNSSEPDASWTLAQLRAEARSRGLTGLSGKKKAEVIAALT